MDGLAIYGGIFTGIFVIIKFCKKYKVQPLEFFDYIAPFVALAQCVGRWGNFFNIEAYGYQTTSIFRMRISDGMGGFTDVHPLFLYESIATLIIFVLLRILQSKRKFAGEIFYLYLFLYSGVRMFLEGLRVDSLMFFDLRISQVLSIIVFLCSGYILVKNTIIYLIKKSKKIKKRKVE